MPRTKWPKKTVCLNGRELSPDEVEKFEKMYQPPLTAKERAIKQALDNARPNNDHLTVWDPSTRR